MNILYVTTLWTGFSDILFNGGIEPKGMPAFLLPLRELIKRGYSVDFIVIHTYSDYPEYDIKIDWINKEQVVGEVVWHNKMSMKLFNIIKLYKTVESAVKTKKYDFIYSHGGSATVSRLLAKKYNIPFGQRLYGTFLYDNIIREGLLKSKITYFLEYDAFKSKKDFLLVTNDGSKGDEAYKIINKKRNPSRFYFWHNGIERMPEVTEEELNERYLMLGGHPFLFYVARIDRWKRQDEAIKILKMLHDRGQKIKLFIAGQIFNQEYYNELLELINNLDLKNYVVFMGVINREEINIMSKLAICSFSLYDVCNLGNVFHEILSAGGIIISKNDGSLDFFIEHQKNGFLLNDINEAPQYIESIISNKEYEKELRIRAQRTSIEKMSTWEHRIDKEIKLIEHTIKGGMDYE